MCITFASCGFSSNSEENYTSDDNISTTDYISSQTTETSAETTVETDYSTTEEETNEDYNTKMYSNLQEYVNAQNFSDVTDSFGDSFKSINVYAKNDDTIVFDLAYATHISVDNSSTKKYLKEAFDTSFDSDMFDSLISDIKDTTNIATPKVKIIIRNDDETILYQKIIE
jgi:hypothetical protein